MDYFPDMFAFWLNDHDVYPFTFLVLSKIAHLYEPVFQRGFRFFSLSFSSQSLLACSLALKYAKVIGLACNSFHALLPELEADITFIHIIQESLSQAKKEKIQAPLILAAKKTIDLNLYNQTELSAIHPSREDQLKITEIIREVASGHISLTQTQTLERLIENYPEADGIVLACTELPLVQKAFPLNTQKPIIDTTEILAKKLIEEALKPF